MDFVAPLVFCVWSYIEMNSTWRTIPFRQIQVTVTSGALNDESDDLAVLGQKLNNLLRSSFSFLWWCFCPPVLQADFGKESRTKCWGGSRNKSRERERRRKSWRRSTLRFVVWSSLAISFLNMVQDMAGRGERRCASTLQVPQTSTHLRVRNFLCRATSSVELSCHEDKRFLFATLSPHRLVTRGSEIFGDFWVTK